MKRRTLAFFFAVSLCAATLVLLSRAPARPLLDVIGIPAEQAEHQCYDPDPDGWIACQLERRSADHVLQYQQTVVRSASTSQIRVGVRTWLLPDSNVWATLVDSVRHAMTRWKGRPTRCGQSRPHPVILHDERWRFRDYVAGLTAARLLAVRDSVTTVEWSLTIGASTDGMFDCERRARPDYRIVWKSPVDWIREFIDAQ